MIRQKNPAKEENIKTTTTTTTTAAAVKTQRK